MIVSLTDPLGTTFILFREFLQPFICPDSSQGLGTSNTVGVDIFILPLNGENCWVIPGAHLEPTTLLCSCKGVFTSKVIFRLNFPLIRLPQEPDDQLQEIKLTS